MAIKVFLFALLLIASPFFKAVSCESESAVDVAGVGEGHDIARDVEDYGDSSFTSAPGVDTVYVFPRNPSRLVTAGEDAEILVGLNNEGGANVNVIAIAGSIHLPYNHRLLVQNLTAQGFKNASVPFSAQATFPYKFVVNKHLQPGAFDLVGTIYYEIDQTPCQSTFFNGTIEVVESGGFFSMESLLLLSLGAALLILGILWAHGQIQQLSKKKKTSPKVEVGTATRDANLDEWLQGTAYAQSGKSKKKK